MNRKSEPKTALEQIQEAMKQDTVALFSDSARGAYAEALIDLMDEGKPVVIVEADLMKSAGTAPVMERYPDRVVQVGIAEQNAVGVAAGLAEMGLIPFVDTFAVLLSRRSADQVWMVVAFSDMNVKLTGLYSGFTTGTNGPTHQSLEDVAIMRSFPNMVIMEPADCSELRQAVRVAAEYEGPVYIRSVRGDMPAMCSEAEPPFEIGQAVMLRPGNDATIIASGVMVQFALEAHEVLAGEGIEARVVNPRTIKPLDEEMVLRCAKETGAVVTVEDHSIIGGLGGAVAEFLSETWPTPLKRVGVQDRFGDAGTFEWLLQAYGMDVPHIVTAVKEVLVKKAEHRGD
jgi:transketolase